MPNGYLAAKYSGIHQPVVVCRSAAGYYIGVLTPELGPVSRESVEYWKTSQDAFEALRSEEWTQREHP